MMSQEHTKFQAGNLTPSRDLSLSDLVETPDSTIPLKTPLPPFQQPKLYLINSRNWPIASDLKATTVEWAYTLRASSSPMRPLTITARPTLEKLRAELLASLLTTRRTPPTLVC